MYWIVQLRQKIVVFENSQPTKLNWSWRFFRVFFRNFRFSSFEFFGAWVFFKMSKKTWLIGCSQLSNLLWMSNSVSKRFWPWFVNRLFKRIPTKKPNNLWVSFKAGSLCGLRLTGKVHIFDRWFLDWTNDCKSCLPKTAKAARDKTATAVKCFIDWTRYVNCSGSMKLGWFGY